VGPTAKCAAVLYRGRWAPPAGNLKATSPTQVIGFLNNPDGKRFLSHMGACRGSFKTGRPRARIEKANPNMVAAVEVKRSGSQNWQADHVCGEFSLLFGKF